MKKISNFFYKMAIFFELLARKFQELSYWDINKINEFYVYCPAMNKPRHKHLSFKEAVKEAKRIKKKNEFDYDVEVLEVVYRIPSEIPF